MKPSAFEIAAARMLARDGVEVIWQLHFLAAASHVRGNWLSALAPVGITDAAERLWRGIKHTQNAWPERRHLLLREKRFCALSVLSVARNVIRSNCFLNVAALNIAATDLDGGCMDQFQAWV